MNRNTTKIEALQEPKQGWGFARWTAPLKNLDDVYGGRAWASSLNNVFPFPLLRNVRRQKPVAAVIATAVLASCQEPCEYGGTQIVIYTQH